jgi:hypothetical protein
MTKQLHSILVAALLAASAGAAQAAQIDVSAGAAVEHIGAGIGDQTLLTLRGAAYATDPAWLPLAVHADLDQGLQSGGLQRQSLGVGLYRTAGPWNVWKLEAGAEAGRTRDEGYTANHWAGVLRARRQVVAGVALDGILKYGRSTGLLGGTYAAAGVGVQLGDIDGGTVRVNYQHIHDGALPSQDVLGLSYGLSF